LSVAGNWEAAARAFDLAASRDGHLAFYHLQRGYAWGMVAQQRNDSEALQRAIDAYERGIRLEPIYALNHANLSVLYRQAGKPEQAIAELRKALELTPTGALATGNNQYGLVVFRRRAQGPDLLPPLRALEITQEQ
jgi:tetratricopeptide (TPR) repeat protein